MSTELGQFAEGIASLRRLMSAATNADSCWRIFENCAHEVAGYVGKGLDRAEAADQLYAMAQSRGLTEIEEDVQDVIADAFAKIQLDDVVPDGIGIDPKTNGHAQVEPHVYLFPDPAGIPPRHWMHAMHYIKGCVVATVAPGGFGKTSLALADALLMAAAGYRVWYISGEDDMQEIDRRIAAFCLNHKDSQDKPQPFTKADFGNRLFVDDKITFPFKIGKSSRNGPDFDEARLQAFEFSIEANKIDVVILDPFVSFHLLAENDTAAMDALIKRMGEVCTRRQCCIELAHHVRKPGMGQFEITVYDARGAAAIVNAVRSCRVLNQMSAVEAQQVQVPKEKRYEYIRIDSGKRNMAPPEKAKWFHLDSIEIGNGDWVQALAPYEFKLVETAIEDEEWVKLTLGEKRYRADSRSEEWFGHEVGRHWGRDTAEKGDIIWVQKQIKKWLNPRPKFQDKSARGPLIRKVEREDEYRHKRLFFELVEE